MPRSVVRDVQPEVPPGMYSSRMTLRRWARPLSTQRVYGMTPKRLVVLLGSTLVGAFLGAALIGAMLG